MMTDKNFDVLQRKAEILRIIAHPVRLSILRGLLKNGATRVTDMETGKEIVAASVSQHLARMNSLGILKKERKAVEVYYSLVDKENLAEMLRVYLEIK
ncbi:MAG: metalloregulator ArsR/SmtB family transcription factor [Candidatus Neomarinimicrobiota bacterium]|jgi:ArsR family transcriptional regulator